MLKKALGVTAFLLICSAGLADENSIGLLMAVKGDLHLVRGSTQIPGKSGLAVFEKDTVVTGADGRGKIAMKDRNIISVSPNTIFKMQTYQNKGDAKNVDLRLKTGKIRTEVNVPYDGEKNTFEVKTKSAVIGVRGTDFISSFNPKSNLTEVITLRGKVRLSGLGRGASTTFISMGQMASVAQDSAPIEAQPVGAEQLNNIKKDFESSGIKSPEGADGLNDSGARQETSPDRLNDKADQTAETFKEAPVDAGKNPLNTPVLRPPKPTSSSPSTDAIQNNQLQKTKVIIQPTPQ